MRRFHPTSVIAAAAVALGLGCAGARGETLNQARGYAQNRCYEEVASFFCGEPSVCYLLVFPETPGQLSFRIDARPAGIAADVVYSRVKFKIAGNDARQAVIVSAAPLHPAEALKELQKATYRAHEASCR